MDKNYWTIGWYKYFSPHLEDNPVCSWKSEVGWMRVSYWRFVILLASHWSNTSSLLQSELSGFSDSSRGFVQVNYFLHLQLGQSINFMTEWVRSAYWLYYCSYKFCLIITGLYKLQLNITRRLKIWDLLCNDWQLRLLGCTVIMYELDNVVYPRSLDFNKSLHNGSRRL